MPSRTKRPASKSTKKGGAARSAKGTSARRPAGKKAGGSSARGGATKSAKSAKSAKSTKKSSAMKKTAKKSTKKSAKKSSAMRASAMKSARSAKSTKSAKSPKAAKRPPAAAKRRPPEKSLGTKIVESAQAAGSWVADTAKELVDKGASLIKPSEPAESRGEGESTEARDTTAGSPSGGVNGHDASNDRDDFDESNEMGEAPKPMKSDD